MAEDRSLKGKVKKKWFKVMAPAIMGKFDLGEIPLYEINTVTGRTLSINLMNLTNDPKKQNTNIKFKITGVKGDQATSELIGFRLVEATIKRLVGRSRAKVADSFLYKTSDGRIIRISPLIIAKAKTSHSVQRALRLSARQAISAAVSKTEFEKFMLDIISGKLQMKIKEDLNKIYPVRIFVIRSAIEDKGIVVAPGEAPKKRVTKKDKEKPEEDDSDPKKTETKQ